MTRRWHPRRLGPWLFGIVGALGFPLVVAPLGDTPLLDRAWVPPRELLLVIAAVWLARVCASAAPLAQKMRAAFSGGLAFFLVLLYWLDIAMRRYGGLPLWQAVPVLLLLASYCAAYWALVPALTHLVRRLALPPPVVFACALVTSEWLRSELLTGFPWGLWGYSQARNLALVQLASIGGVFGLSFLIALWAGGVAQVIDRWSDRAARGRVARWLVGSLVTAHAVGAVLLCGRAPDRELGLRAAIIQGNVEQRIKNRGQEHRESILRAYEELSASAVADGAELVVWPEAAWPEHLPADLRRLPRGPTTRWLLGVATIDTTREPGRAANSAFWAVERRVVARYDKRHLVPFGEYVPLRRLLPVERFVPGSIDYQPGSSAAPIGSPPIGVLICYDGIFPRLARQSVAAGAVLLANLTNDGWYGRSSAAYQHHDFYVLRAIETDRWLIRAANTGRSSFIGPDGRVHGGTRLATRTVTAGQVWPRETVTAYVRLGDWPVALALGACLAALLERIAARLRRRPPVDNPTAVDQIESDDHTPPSGALH